MGISQFSMKYISFDLWIKIKQRNDPRNWTAIKATAEKKPEKFTNSFWPFLFANSCFLPCFISWVVTTFLSLLPNHSLTTEAWNCISTRGKTCEPWYFVPNRHIIIFPVCTVFFFCDCCRVWKEKWYEVWYCRMSYLRQITYVRQNRKWLMSWKGNTYLCWHVKQRNDRFLINIYVRHKLRKIQSVNGGQIICHGGGSMPNRNGILSIYFRFSSKASSFLYWLFLWCWIIGLFQTRA